MLNRSAKDTAVFFDEIQVRHQVFRSDQVQFLQRTSLKPFNEFSGILRHVRNEFVDDIPGALHQKIIQCFIVKIEGRTVDACLFADLLHRNIGKVLFFQQRQKRLIHAGGGGKIFILRAGQWTSPLSFFACATAYTRRSVSRKTTRRLR